MRRTVGVSINPDSSKNTRVAPRLRAFFLDEGRYTGSTSFVFGSRHLPIEESGVVQKIPFFSVVSSHDRDDTALTIPLQ